MMWVMWLLTMTIMLFIRINHTVTIIYHNKNFVSTNCSNNIFCCNKLFLIIIKILYCNKTLLQQIFCCNSLLPQTLSQQWETKKKNRCNRSLLQQFEVNYNKKFHCNKVFFLLWFLIWYFICNFTNLYQNYFFINVSLIYIMNYNYGIFSIFLIGK